MEKVLLKGYEKKVSQTEYYFNRKKRKNFELHYLQGDWEVIKYFVLLVYYGNYTFYQHNRQLLKVQITLLLMFVVIGWSRLYNGWNIKYVLRSTR